MDKKVLDRRLEGTIISIPNLLDSGFKEYKSQFDRDRRCFQKRVRDERGTKYFIDCKYFDWSGFPTTASLSPSFEFDVQFNIGDDTLNMQLLSRKDRTIKEVYEFFENAFVKLNAEYYD